MKRVKEILTSGLFFTFFLYFSEIISILLVLIYPNVKNMSLDAQRIYICIMEILFICLIVFTYKKDYIQDFNIFKNKFNEYFKKYLKFWIIGLIVMGASNLVLSSIFDKIAENESAIRSTFKVSPFYVYFASVILAPLLEEGIFRFNLRKIVDDKWSFILLSGLLFAAMHIVGNITAWYDLLYIIPYSSLGIAFAYMYVDSKNIFVSTMFHLLHNGLLMSLEFLLLMFV